MANINFTVNINEELGRVTIFPSARQDIQPGDTITFNPGSGFPAGSITIGPFSGDHFTSTASGSLNSGNTVVRTVKASPVFSEGSVTCAKASYLSAFALYSVITDVDDIPDAFSIGPDFLLVHPSQTFYSDQMTVSGLNNPTIGATTTNGDLFVNNILRTPPWPIDNGDKIHLRFTSPAGYSDSKTVTLTLGSVSDSLICSTANSPDSGETLNAPFATVPVGLRAVGDFFGYRLDGFTPLPYKLTDYLRGGDFVPDIAANSAVPNSLPMSLASLAGSATSLYFASNPPNRAVNVNTIGSAQTMTVFWVLSTDWTLGYGTGMDTIAQTKYEVFLDVAPAGRDITDITITTPTGSHTVYSTANTGITLEAEAPFSSEGIFRGRVKFYHRHPSFPAQEITTEASFFLNYYGP